MAALAIPIASAVVSVCSGLYSSWKTWRSGKLREAEKTQSEAKQKRLLEELKKEHKEAEKARCFKLLR